MAKRKKAKRKTDQEKAAAQKTDQKKWKPQKPRRWTPKEAQGVIGRLMIPGMLLAIVAIYLQWILLLIPAGVIWVIALLILYQYWRCPECGKTLPKMGKVHECPRCGAKID